MYNRALHFHFTGIGGSGMSGLAEILLGLGFKVSGSDLVINEVCKRLESKGAEIFNGHDKNFLPSNASLLVYSSAVVDTNPEVVEAKKRGIPVIPRAEVLAELMRLKYGVGVAGSHGKTTTTSMTAAILEKAGIDPTVVIGGKVKSLGSGSKLGKGDFLVAETDESDRSFLLLKPTIAIITNIDAEHMNAYSSMTDLEESFSAFAESVPFYGLAILCIDNPRVRSLAENYHKRKMTYGLSVDARLRASDIKHLKGSTSYKVSLDGEEIMNVTLPVPGEHLVVNSLAAIAVGLELDVEPSIIEEGLRSFKGVSRRLEILSDSESVIVVSDYAHHPTEIKATLRAIKTSWGADAKRIHAVFQPHRYTRTRDSFAEFLTAFTDADTLMISDIYAASEQPIEGISSEILTQAISSPKSRKYIGAIADAHKELAGLVSDGDIVVFLGAGTIGNVAESYAKELKREIRNK